MTWFNRTHAESDVIVPETAGDLLSLGHLYQHPVLAPIIAQRTALKHERDQVREERRRTYFALRDAETKAGIDPTAPALDVPSSIRVMREKCEALKTTEANVESQIQGIQVDIDDAAASVADELERAAKRASLAPLSAMIDGLEQLIEANQRLQALNGRTRRLLGFPVPGWEDATLERRLEELHQLRGMIARGLELDRSS